MCIHVCVCVCVHVCVCVSLCAYACVQGTDPTNNMHSCDCVQKLFARTPSEDGHTWSEISMSNDDTDHRQVCWTGRARTCACKNTQPTPTHTHTHKGAFNLSRPYIDASGARRNVSYYSARPKLLLAADGVTPTHLYGSTSVAGRKGSFTIVSPLATDG